MSERRNTPRYNDSFDSCDRRINNRISAELVVTAYVENSKFKTRMRNMSGNGMQVIDPPRSRFQSNQDCRIQIKNEFNTIELNARVIWKKHGLIGLSFTNSEHQIQHQVNKLSRKLLMSSIAANGMSALT